MEALKSHIENPESQNAENPRQDQEGQEQDQKLSQQEEDQDKFQQLVDELFAEYEPDSVLEEAAAVTIARALWLKRSQLEFSSDTRRLDQEISTALSHLSKSKALRRTLNLGRPATGIMRTVHAKHPYCGLIRRLSGRQRRSHRRPSRETLQRLAPPTGKQGVGNGLSPEEVEKRRRDRIDELRCKAPGEMTREESEEYDTLTRWRPARIEDHPMYEQIVAWGKAAAEGRERINARLQARKERIARSEGSPSHE
jgi:hypothetical protein